MVFEYSHLKLYAASISSTGMVEVSFEVKNVGERPGADVAQLYTHQEHSAVAQPIKSLRAFTRVTLQPGETTHVQLMLLASQMAYWDVHRGGLPLSLDRSMSWSAHRRTTFAFAADSLLRIAPNSPGCEVSLDRELES